MVDITLTQAVIGGVATALGGGGVSSIFNWLAQRGKQSSIAQDAVNRAVKTALDSTGQEIDRLNKVIERMLLEIRDMKLSHEAEMRDCHDRHDKCEEEQRKLREEIERLMAQMGAAEYKRSDLRRVP